MSDFCELASVDGRITPTAAATIGLKDDGLYRGDGVFEVIRLYAGRPFALDDHLDRLGRSGAAIALEFDRPALEAEIEALLARAGQVDGQLRLIVTRGGRRIAATEPVPPHAAAVAVAIVPYSTTGILDRVKSLSYAANMHATRLARQSGADEAVLIAADGTVLEPPTSTVFWASADGTLRTPSLQHPILDSITRDRLVAALEVEQGSFPVADLRGASEGFLASTTREVQPIASVDGEPLPNVPGPRTLEAQRAFAAVLERELGDELMALLQISADEAHVGLVQLDSPETRNALSPAMKEELLGALRRLDADPEIRCVVIAGSEQAFAAGADIRDLAERGLEAPADPVAEAFWAGIGELGTPLVAAVNGYALGGGCELALACDMIVADKDARFGLPEVTLGIIPGGGGTQRLTRAIGKHRAMEYVLTGRQFDAEMALEWGLVNAAVAKRACLRTALELARTVAERPPLATRLAKRAVLTADEEALSAGIASERRLFDQAMATEDRIEGMQAFIEKREPNFRGR